MKKSLIALTSLFAISSCTYNDYGPNVRVRLDEPLIAGTGDAVYKSKAEKYLPILDYGEAKYFSYYSSVNNLYIDIKGRMNIKKDDENLEYILLAPHPREITWNLEKRAYADMIKLADGASMITFIMEKGGDSVISRRFESNVDFFHQHECGKSPYGKNPTVFRPKELEPNSLLEIHTTKEIYLAALEQKKIYGVLDYKIDGYSVRIDFPIDLINLNPNSNPFQSEWQAVSSIIPIYVGGNPKCQGIREGVVAMRDFLSTHEFVYLCEGKDESASRNDFRCTLEFDGALRLFRRY